MTHEIAAAALATAIEDAEVDEAVIDRSHDCSVAGRLEICGALLVEDHNTALKVLLALAAHYDGEARLLADTLTVKQTSRWIAYTFPGVHFTGPITPFDKGV